MSEILLRTRWSEIEGRWMRRDERGWREDEDKPSEEVLPEGALLVYEHEYSTVPRTQVLTVTVQYRACFVRRSSKVPRYERISSLVMLNALLVGKEKTDKQQAALPAFAAPLGLLVPALRSLTHFLVLYTPIILTALSTVLVQHRYDA